MLQKKNHVTRRLSTFFHSIKKLVEGTLNFFTLSSSSVSGTGYLTLGLEPGGLWKSELWIPGLIIHLNHKRWSSWAKHRGRKTHTGPAGTATSVASPSTGFMFSVILFLAYVTLCFPWVTIQTFTNFSSPVLCLYSSFSRETLSSTSLTAPTLVISSPSCLRGWDFPSSAAGLQTTSTQDICPFPLFSPLAPLISSSGSFPLTSLSQSETLLCLYSSPLCVLHISCEPILLQTQASREAQKFRGHAWMIMGEGSVVESPGTEQKGKWRQHPRQNKMRTKNRVTRCVNPKCSKQTGRKMDESWRI